MVREDALSIELTDGVASLQPLGREDAPAWVAGDDEEARFWFQFPGSPTLEGVIGWIEQTMTDWREAGPRRYFGIREAVGGTLCGGVEVRRREDGKANISWVVFPQFRGRSYATRGAVLAADFAIRELTVDAVVAIVDAMNVKSRSVAVAAGFQLDGQADPWEHSETGEMLRYTLVPR